MTKKPKQQDLGITVETHGTARSGPVECLGMTFPNDNERRTHFVELLRQKLKDPEFRKIEGFPIGADEAILALSDPPYYTACPNPWLGDMVRWWTVEREKADSPSTPDPRPASRETYHREPFAVDVSEGKTHPIYKAHSYHTKVPHLAIVPSILHYTEPGDIVLDGFCGSGMTGVAAQWCGTAPDDYRRELEDRWKKEGMGKPRWGLRYCILNDLSPTATFIAANYNLPFDVDEFVKAARKLLDEVEAEIGWMYETLHTDGKTKGRIEYTVWSEVLSCPECGGEVVFLKAALDGSTKRVRKVFRCPNCSAQLTKSKLTPLFETVFDPVLGTPCQRPKREPVLISYRVGRRRYEKSPDAKDIAALRRIEGMAPPLGLPVAAYPFDEMWEAPRLLSRHITHVHHLFLPRALHVLGAYLTRVHRIQDTQRRNTLLILAQHQFKNASVMNRYRPASSFGNAPLTGVYYVSSLTAEANVISLIRGSVQRVRRMGSSGWSRMLELPCKPVLTTGDARTFRGVGAESVDYVFTDPPFGDNYPYAELNFLVEAWYGVLTDMRPEAIVDRRKRNQSSQKSLRDYELLMQQCFGEYYRVLKPGHWMTVVFHNSKNAVWRAIQQALDAAGFVVADVRTMDKKQSSFKQVTSSAVKQDLIISAYKPNGGLEKRFKLTAGTEEGVWDFLRTHLRQLPVCVIKGEKIEPLAERKAFQLYDRMVAFHVQRGVTVPMSSAEFHLALAAGKFVERDDMIFLPEQVAEYDRKRMQVQEVGQLELIPRDEESTIRWIREELKQKPRSFQDLQPDFMRAVSWEKHEKSIELSEVLDQNFLSHDGSGDVPSQIHSYLSTNWPELRKLAKDSDVLRAKAKGRWYVPDPNKAGDLEKIREKALLREFWEYLPQGYTPPKPGSQDGLLPGFKAPKIPKGKRLTVIRLEAVRAGFKYCWQNKDYQTIIAVARRIPDDVLQEDPKLLMWYDQAMTRLGE